MALAFTPTLLIATKGLLENSGLGVNVDLKAEVTRFNTTNVSGSVQTALTANSELFEEFAKLPSFLTGIVPLGVGDSDRTLFPNIPQAILDQGKFLFRPPGSQDPDAESVFTYISVFSQANGYVQNLFGVYACSHAFDNKDFSDLGFAFKNFADVASGGVTSQFNPAGVPALSQDLMFLGSMYDISDPSQLFKPTSVAKSLLKQGLGFISNLEQQINTLGIDINEEYPTDATQKQLTAIFETIKSNDLAEIFEVTNFNPKQKSSITSLAEVLNINKVLSPEAMVAVGKDSSLDDLASKISNLGGKFSSLKDLSVMLSKLDLSSQHPELDKLTTLTPPGLASSLTISLGKGSGVFGNPTLNDLLSCASGYGYINSIKAINDSQTSLLQRNSNVQALKNYLDATDNIDATHLGELIDAVIDTSYLDPAFTANEQTMIHMSERYLTEKNNLSAAGIAPGTGDNSQVISFAFSLWTLGTDSMNLGMKEQILGIIKPGTEGDAIRASIAEGKNLASLAAYGIDPGTKLNPMDYAVKLVNSNQ